MKDLVYEIAGAVALFLDAVAVLLVAAGAAEAAVAIVRQRLSRKRDTSGGRAIYLQFARWLVGALTFQLGADIVETTIAPGWEEIGHMAAVAAVRTFLTYFLDRDLERVEAGAGNPAHEPHSADERATKVQ